MGCKKKSQILHYIGQSNNKVSGLRLSLHSTDFQEDKSRQLKVLTQKGEVAQLYLQHEIGYLQE